MSSRSLALAGTAVMVLCATVAFAQTAVPAGGQFQVNSDTAGSQEDPAVAAQRDGGFGVVWSGAAAVHDTSLEGIEARLFATDGSPRAAQGPVNSYTTGSQKWPRVAAAGDGSFVVVWASDGSGRNDFDGLSIQAQRFDRDGLFLGEQFQVNTLTTGDQISPDVTVAGDGGFVVVWEDRSPGEPDVRGQRFASDGAAIGEEFQVNAATTGIQSYPAVAADAEGDFVVVWSSRFSTTGTDDDSFSIQGRLFDSNGSPVALEDQVNTITLGSQKLPRVAADAEGNFVVVWQSESSGDGDDDGYSIQGRLYASNGVPVGVEAQVNTYTAGSQTLPAVAANANGEFVVVWTSNGSEGTDVDGLSIQGRVFGPGGLAIGLQAQVNSYTMGLQANPAVAIDRHGDFVVTWRSLGSFADDDSGASIQAQRYLRFVFADGFETGDVCGWSEEVGSGDVC